jgi:hypothetical protein
LYYSTFIIFLLYEAIICLYLHKSLNNKINKVHYSR